MPLWAEFDGESAAFGAAITATFGGLLALVKYIWPRIARRRREREQREDGIYQTVIKGHEEQAERDRDTIRQDQKAIKALQKANAECREENAEMRAAVHFLYDTAKRHNAALRHLGQDPGELPELPKMRDRLLEKADFLARQAAQSAGLGEAARQVQPRPPDGEAGP